uniref:peptidylprolyl isomerase n=1 Tax=Campylobacter concisus TaxID=199 RepID=UPI000CD918C2|nr:peptidyl-prolyl cis-trans isomerase [Campylobacter concisus]
MVKPFSDAAFSMKNKTFSPKPVKTDFGYHVIYKKDSKLESIASFEEVKSYVESQVKQDKFKEQTAKLAKSLLEKAKIEYK